MAIKQLTPPEAHDALAKSTDALYLDVRTEAEFAQGHPAGAINIPVVFIKAPGQTEPNPDFLAVAEKSLAKSKQLVVGCQVGIRSQRACEILESAGYADLINVRGGFGGERNRWGRVVVEGWRDAGLPITNELGDASYPALRKKAGL